MMLNKIKKFALGVEYNGSFYHGWQRQKNVPSVQEEIEIALSKIANHQINVICAGRTDAGVHSTGQVIHFSTTTVRKITSWMVGANSYLSKYIAIKWIQSVPENFHARYSAITRSYRYVIYNNNIRSVFLSKQFNFVYKKLNEKKMLSAAQYLLGEHDFTSFRAIGCQSSSAWRTIKKLNIFRLNNFIIIDITANSFLYHMVRNIVGALISVGSNQKTECWMQQLLKKKNRKYASATASAEGLYLSSIEYPLYFNIPDQKHTTIFF